MLAALAVLLAALSLTLLATGEVEEHSGRPIALLVLACIKLAIVVWIFVNTRNAKNGDWNDRAVDYRYLNERLRSMTYLPLIGSFRPPSVEAPQHASRVVRQSAVDWLFGATVRSISPADLPQAKLEHLEVDACDHSGKVQVPVKLYRVDPHAALTCVRYYWIEQQAIYHAKTTRTMESIHEFIETWTRKLNIAVIGGVALDIALLVLNERHFLSAIPPLETLITKLHEGDVWLIFLAAVLPAAVASLNGLRFQSECLRLAERSAHMRAILAGREPQSRDEHHLQRSSRWFAPSGSEHSPKMMGGLWEQAWCLQFAMWETQARPKNDPASWCLEVLEFVEPVAALFAREVAEWSVVYAKELPET